jgi:hypothetical protein
MSKNFERDIFDVAEEIMSGKNLKDHDFEHVRRVVGYGKRIIREESIFEEHLCDILAALYCHDIGRVDDSKDDKHGLRSAVIFDRKIYPKFNFLDLKTIYFTIINHQNYRPEKGKYPVVDNYVLPQGLNKIVPIIVWDADRLDLARIKKFKGKINSNYLHTDFAKRFANSKEHLSIY